MSIISKIFGDPNEKELQKLQPLVEAINILEEKFKKLSDKGITKKTKEFQTQLKNGRAKDDILPKVFALVREAAKRTLGQRHYDVQLMGGIVLHQGKIAEMKTGEGKTLSATLPVYLNALDEKGVHVITVNDYLAKRDTVWMGQIYHALGLSVACIAHDTAYIYDPSYVKTSADKPLDEVDEERDETGSFRVEDSYLRPISRKQAYQADITYGTNNEFGFDYLRDNLAHDINSIIQRELHYTIIDEIDSILIDEARTPLIISAPAEESADLYYKLARLIKGLKRNEDYTVDEKMRAVMLTEGGVNKMTAYLGEDPWENNNFTSIHHIDVALKAQTLFQKDRDYVIKDNEIIIVDEFTGRLMHGRRYSEGIHQAIEAKENVDIKKESKTLATITFQNYFRYYEKLSGMTGTAVTEAEEFHKIYDLDVVVIPTNKEMIRKSLSDRIYRTKEAKFKAIVNEVKQRHEKGQPILIGTGGFTIGEQTVGAIEKNRIIKDLLEREGLQCEVLDATNHEREGQIIAQAGKRGAITVATNMAGRGVDVILGGNPLNKDEQKKILELGGLHIIGTERHEARRIDNQLRGRSGRQGDPGSSQFFISLEDDLMRIFGGARLSSVMQTLKVPEDMPIESKVVSSSIEKAQQKVEGFNFDTRKHLLEYDDVLSKHREAIYRKRKKILTMTEYELRDEVLTIVEQELTKVVRFHTQDLPPSSPATRRERGAGEKWEIDKIVEVVRNIFTAPDDLGEALTDIYKQAGDKKSDEYTRNRLIKYLVELATNAYDGLEQQIAESREQLGLQKPPKGIMTPIAKSIILQSIDRYWLYHLQIIENLKGGIGLRAYGQRDPLVEYKKESYQKFQELMGAVNKQVAFSIYKVGMVDPVRSPNQGFGSPDTSGLTSNGVEKVPERPRQARQNFAPQNLGGQEMRLSGAQKTTTKKTPDVHERLGLPLETESPNESPSKETRFHTLAVGNRVSKVKVGRNDPCPCGKVNPETGKPVKYKKCHGA
ncbi:preprotein translocase subunit SecA [Patescibacteria group bacterium AH-259-L07]|nr:preprotein translocase subunit SecA [Patescibacteria group bacterium AH-259-L07]